ncbi:MAG: tetratricopeptide repeat protein [Planctomycetaceae bacterium]|nr:tetratricopeptide repeat protein [Planctomycetaceae bacterium]
MISDEYDDVSDEPNGGTRWKLVLAIVSFSLLVFTCWSLWPSPPPKPPEGVKQADYDKAALEFAAKAHRRAEHSDTLITLADSAVRRNRIGDAMKLLEQVPFSDVRNGQGALRRRAQLALKDNQIELAESALTELLKRAEATGTTDTDECRFAKEILGFIYAMELRFDERKQIMSQLRDEVLLEPLLSAQYHFPSLIPWRSPQQRERLMEFLKKDPANVKLLVAYARHLIGEGKTDDAEKLLNVILQQHPKYLPAVAAQAECLYSESQWQELQSLLESAPEFSTSEPWLLTQMRAESATQAKNWKDAEAYYNHLLTVDPANPAYYLGFAEVCANTNREQQRREAQRSASLLSELRIILPDANEKNAGAIKEVAAQADNLGLKNAAKDFQLLAAKLGGQMPDGESPNSFDGFQGPKGP